LTLTEQGKQMSVTIPGIVIDNEMWKIHIEQITPKLRASWYAMRYVTPHMSQETFNMFYYSYFHSTMSYGLFFFGNPFIQCKNVQDIKKYN
jgi:hypothetical protein